MADALMRLSDWAAATPGYGNLFLAARCDDLATLAIGRLLINLDIPLERILPLVAALDMPYKTPSFRREVLNNEAGAELFPSLADEQEMMLLFPEIWNTGEAGRMLYNAVELASMPQHADMFRQVKRRLPTLRAHAAFFHDENPPEPRTTAAIWEYKCHWDIVAGIRDQNIRSIQALAAFRQVVGSFPEKLVFVYTEEERKNKEAIERLTKEAGIHFLTLFITLVVVS